MNNKMLKQFMQKGIDWATRLGLMLICACSNSTLNVDGGGTRGGNPVVTGMIAGVNGNAAKDVRVTLLSENYNPVIGTPPEPSFTDTTDSLGLFTITAPDSGWYNLEAVRIFDGTRLIKFKVKAIWDSTLVLPIDTLHRPGKIKVIMPDGNNLTDGYMYVPGTSIATLVADSSNSVIIDSVPAEILPALFHERKNSTERKAVRYDISVRSDETTVIDNPQWSYSRQIILNTSSSGASVSGDVNDFPVLIRLNSENFNFKQARSDGGDLMFTRSDNVPLSYEIERWDASHQKAEIWVKVDTVYGDSSEQSFNMFWGNPAGSTGSNSAAVFDTAKGFQGVWHLDEDGNQPALDATVNHFNGTAYHMADGSQVSGEIGKARVFDGDSSYITMSNTASGKLNFPEDGNFTVSAWVYVDILDSAYRTIVSKGFQQYFLQLTIFPSSNPPLWEFADFSSVDNFHMSNTPATAKQWVLLTGVVQGSNQYLYCNGELVSNKSVVYNQYLPRDTSDDLTIGRFFKEATYPTKFGYCWFKGRIDEVRICSNAKNHDWVVLSYMNQRSDDRLVQLK